MPQPAIGELAQRAYDALAPLAYDEANRAWALAIFLGALGDSLFQEIDDYASDNVDGDTGWSLMIDLNRVPDKALPWLAQFVGVDLRGGLTPADQRQQMSGLANWKRGSVLALEQAPKPYLTGAKVVVFRERDGSPNTLTVITYTSQTPDSAKVLSALMAQKPAGIILNYYVRTGQDYQSLKNNHPTYANVYASYATYQGIVTDQPGL